MGPAVTDRVMIINIYFLHYGKLKISDRTIPGAYVKLVWVQKLAELNYLNISKFNFCCHVV